MPASPNSSGASAVVDPDDPDAPPRLYLSRYARADRARDPRPSLPGRKSKPTIAVVTLAGPIVSGRGGRQLSPLGTSSAGGDTIAAALREAGADDDVVGRRAARRQSRRIGHRLGNHLARGGSAARGGQARRRVDGRGRRVRRLLRVDGRRRDRRQPGHHHRLDRRDHRQAGGPRPQGSARHRLGLGAHQRQRRRVVGRTRRSPTSSTPTSRPRPTCSTPTSSSGSPRAAT